jgi:hypothetical protein
MLQKDIKNDKHRFIASIFRSILRSKRIFQKGRTKRPTSKAANQFVSEIANATEALENEGYDTSRLLMTTSAKLESAKKYSSADIVAGVSRRAPAGSSWTLL